MNNRLTAEGYRAEQHATQRAERGAALEKFVQLTYRYPGTSSHPWKGLTFDQGGAARLASIAGWITGVAHAGSIKGLPMEALANCHEGALDLTELAAKMALDLDSILCRLAESAPYEIEVDDGRQTVAVPRRKVVLGDDGTFNGFTVLYYQPFVLEKVQAKARQIDEAAYQGKEADGTELSEEDSRQRWDAALTQAKQKLRIREKVDSMDFTESRYFTPQWVQDRRAKYQEDHKGHKQPDSSIYSCSECDIGSYALSGSSEWVRYGFYSNGGLLYRGPGGANVFDITLDPGAGTERFWSLHS